jgi:hypothetical protein
MLKDGAGELSNMAQDRGHNPLKRGLAFANDDQKGGRLRGIRFTRRFCPSSEQLAQIAA